MYEAGVICKRELVAGCETDKHRQRQGSQPVAGMGRRGKKEVRVWLGEF